LIVTSVSAEEAAQIYQVREVLEGLAGRGFAERATDEQVSRLKTIVDRLAKMVSDDSPPEIESVLKLKKQFYEVLLDGCGNVSARQLLTQLHKRIVLLRATSLSEPTRLKDNVKEMHESWTQWSRGTRKRHGGRASTM
jgi:DNA-binding GntR family transcriptional regulator